MSNEQIYLYRRKGLSDYATCDRARYVELSQHKLFETMICYASAESAERLGIDLELTRLARQGDQIEIDGLKALCDGFRAQLADAAQSLETISRLAGRDEFMEDMTDVRGYANSRASVARGALSVSTEPPAPATAECTSCDGSGEYIDAIGDWRGYCSCPAGVALKNRPAPVSAAPDGWRLVPLHPTMDMLEALMEWNKVGNVNAYNNILNAAPACPDKIVAHQKNG